MKRRAAGALTFGRQNATQLCIRSAFPDHSRQKLTSGARALSIKHLAPTPGKCTRKCGQLIANFWKISMQNTDLQMIMFLPITYILKTDCLKDTCKPYILRDTCQSPHPNCELAL